MPPAPSASEDHNIGPGGKVYIDRAACRERVIELLNERLPAQACVHAILDKRHEQAVFSDQSCACVEGCVIEHAVTDILADQPSLLDAGVRAQPLQRLALR